MMKFATNETMTEATRLVALGDLRGATAMIQRSLGNPAAGVDGLSAGSQSSATEDRDGGRYHASSSKSPFLDGVFRRVFEEGSNEFQDPVPGPSPDGDNVTSETGRFISLTHRAATGSRSYKLYIPAGDAAKPRPLIVMLHGCTQSPDDFATGTRMNDLADQHGVLVAYPAQPQSSNNSKCWNWFNPADQHRDRGEPSLIAGIAREVAAQHAVDPERIHLAGFSAGAAMAVVMAAAYPDLFASVAVHSGLALGVARDVASALTAMRSGGQPSATTAIRIPTIVFHGDRDTTVHPRNGEQIVQQCEVPYSGGDAPSADSSTAAPIVEPGKAPGGRPFTRRILRGTRERPLLEHWRLHGGGHGWSGGSPAGSHTDPKGPDASRELVRFFLQNPRALSPTGS